MAVFAQYVEDILVAHLDFLRGLFEHRPSFEATFVNRLRSWI